MGSVLDIIITIITICVPLFGGVFTVLLFYYRDIMEREPRIAVVKTFLWGLFAGVIIIAVTIPLFIIAQKILNNISNENYAILFMIFIVLIQALYEEVVKGLILWKRCFRLICEIDGLFDGFFYGAIIGTGAGVVDAIAYALLATDWLQGLEIALIRTIRIPGTHALFTGLLGMFCTWHKYKEKNITPGIIYAIILHTVWNVVTYLFHYYLNDIILYVANFSLLAIYLILMSVISTMLIRYDKKYFPEGIPEKAGACEIQI